MEISGGITASLAGRYAAALYDLAGEQGVVTAVETDLDTLGAAVRESADLAALLKNPEVARDVAARTIDAVAAHLKLSDLTRKFLGVLAANRRLASLPDVVRAFTTIAAAARGEVTAEVTTAHPLDDAQLTQLADKLKAREGRSVTVKAHVDPAILGGLVVQIGSRMIDGSIRTRLNSLAQAMKG